MYHDGVGVPKNYVLSHMWCNLAAANPSSDKEHRDDMVRFRHLIASVMTPAQIAEAQRLATEWKPQR
jgi:hypothetical protein